MPVMDYVYRQYSSSKKKGGEKKIKDVLTITSKWIQEVQVFVRARVCLHPTYVSSGMKMANKNALHFAHNIINFLYFYKLMRSINHRLGGCGEGSLGYLKVKGHWCIRKDDIRDAHLTLDRTETNNNRI